jgi:hypothetical protein
MESTSKDWCSCKIEEPFLPVFAPGLLVIDSLLVLDELAIASPHNLYIHVLHRINLTRSMKSLDEFVVYFYIAHLLNFWKGAAKSTYSRKYVRSDRTTYQAVNSSLPLRGTFKG